MKVVVSIDAPGADRDVIAALASWAVEHCPVTETITRQVPLQLEIH